MEQESYSVEYSAAAGAEDYLPLEAEAKAEAETYGNAAVVAVGTEKAAAGSRRVDTWRSQRSTFGGSP